MARNKMSTTTLKRVFKFIIRMERMGSERWAKICWEKIKRGVKNEMATEWQDLAEIGAEWWRGTRRGI